MTTSGSYNIGSSPHKISAEIRRLANQARSGWEKEARALAWFGLEDGMSVLEPGSGPGFITEQLLDLFPNIQITCLELNPALLAQAEQHLRHKANQRVQLIEGSVMDTGLEANQFDWAYGRYLFQHLPDPLGAAQEIWRVLKPGGKLVIHDIDDELFGLFEPPLSGLSRVIEKFGEAQAARGGNRHIGRHLWQMLEQAGFQNLDLEVLVSHSGTSGIEPFLQQIHPDRMLSLVEQGLLSEEELAQYRAAHTAYKEDLKPFTIWLSLMICGEKP